MSQSRLRFAPSPTGNLHIGTLRTALFNWIYSKSVGATLVLRIEDTDLSRSQSEYETNINQGLAWLDLSMDEGPAQGGAYGPYRQSERIQLGYYHAAANRLLAEGHAYRCFCTEAELTQEREAAEAEKRPYTYSGKCRRLTSDEVIAKQDAQIPSVVKFAIPEGAPVRVVDIIRGDIDFERSLIGDFVLIKSDQTPSYNFAVVVDDGMMAVTQVVRGEDHISNTPKQILLFEALGYPVPRFAHLPMILGPDKSKLSKRHGATGITEYRDQGFLPEAMFNYLVLLGWSSPDSKEIMTRDEIVERFTLDRISKSGAVFDITKLKWMNGQYIRSKSSTQLMESVIPFLSPSVHTALQALGAVQMETAIYSIRDNLEVLTDCNRFLEVYAIDVSEFEVRVSDYLFTETDGAVVQSLHRHLTELANWSIEAIESVIGAIVTELALGKGKVYKPIRVATSGFQSGPHLSELIWVLGRATVLSRLVCVQGRLATTFK